MNARFRASPWRLPPVGIIIALAIATAGGCGAIGGVLASEPTAGDAITPGLSGDTGPKPGELDTAKTVVLDWTGGSSAILDQEVGATDFSLMYTGDVETLDEEREEFEHAVLARMEEILVAIQPASFRIVIGEAESYEDATVVYFTGEVGSGGTAQAGQTKLDQCDLRPGGDIVVWGGSLLAMRDTFEFDEWVHLFANVAAHEVGHTVGFYHPDAYLTDLTEYQRTTEIMMAVRTLSALRGPQGFVIPQETCPSDISQKYGGVAYGLSGAAVATPAAKPALSTSRPACVCQVVADDE